MAVTSKTRGIYVLGNDRVVDDALAFLNSMQQHAPGYPIRLIPYDEEYHKLLEIVAQKFGVEVIEDSELFDALEQHSRAIRGSSAPMYRKHIVWSGPFDEFIYFDLDIVVLHPLDHIFELLTEYDIAYAGDARFIGVEEVFTEKVFEHDLFTQAELADVFNAGFFASKKGMITREQLLFHLEEAAKVRDIFVPYLQDQPFTNFLVLRTITRRCNIRKIPSLAQDAWAGLPTLEIREDKVYKKNGMPVGHIHWAGFNQLHGRPYVRLWLKYRYPGRIGAIQRPIVRLWWLACKISRRLMCTHVEGWYRPSYQLKRVQRIARRVLNR